MKTQFKYVFLSYFVVTIVGGLRPNCPIPKIKNGTFRMQRAGRMGYFYCAPGFEIHGAMSILCTLGRWKQDLPICIKSGCRSPPMRQKGWVMNDEKKQKSMVFCQDGYIVAGSSTAFCDGDKWDRELGECRLDVNHTKMCDFETTSMCGWEPDDDNDFHWTRRNGWNSFEKLEFGPRHDHTKGKPLDGYYLTAEATNSRSTQKSRLLSPIYSENDSKNACFRFYYHMYGRNIGRLRVIVKSENETMDEILNNPRNILFERENNQGNQWNEAFFTIEPINARFQIIFEATGGKGPINDIAIDDVALLKDGDCMKFSKIDVASEEPGGIYDAQSCASRCMETESVRGHVQFLTFLSDHITETCDCHQECADLNTCCLDYVTFCNESAQSGEPDANVSIRNEDVTTEMIPDIPIKTTTRINSSTTPRPQTTPISTSSTPISSPTSTNSTPTTTAKPSAVVTSTSIRSSINTTITDSTSLKTSTYPSTRKSFVTKVPYVKNTSLASTSVTKYPTKSSAKSTVPTKTTTIIPKIVTKPIQISTKTTKTDVIMPKTSKYLITTRSTKWIDTATKSTPKIAQTSSTVTYSTTLKNDLPPRKSFSRNTAKPTNPLTSTDSTQLTRTQFAWISIAILICVLSTAMLIGWKQLSGHKWNQFNSNPIEFKSNYNSDEHNEPLVRSNSFIIDDSFTTTLINRENIDGDNLQFEKTNSYSKGKNVAAEKAKVSMNTPNKMKKTSERKTCDQFSEKRCLTDDDEQFDFSLQIDN